MNIDKQVEYWRNGAEEDIKVAGELINRGYARHGLFFGHLAIEKALKAHVCRLTQDLAPRIHNLLQLAEIAKLKVSAEYKKRLAELNLYNLAGRYPEKNTEHINKQDALKYLSKIEALKKWLIKRLSNR